MTGVDACFPAPVPLPSPVQIILNTSPDVGDLREVMSYVYDEIFVEYVIKNPLYTRGQPFRQVKLHCSWSDTCKVI